MTILDRLTIFLIFLYAALRALSGGLDTAEPETAFLSIIAAAAFGGAIIGAIRTHSLIFPDRFISIAVLVFAALSTLSVVTAQAANWQAAVDLFWNWFADAQIFLAVVIVCRRYPIVKMLGAILVADLAVSALFGLYQRFYATDYFRSLIAGADMAFANDESFWIRVNSLRIYGQFSYANAYAGFIISLLPLLAFFFRRSKSRVTDVSDKHAQTGAQFARSFFDKILPLGLLLAVMLALVYSGSKAGFIAAKIGETLSLFYLTSPPRRIWQFGEIIGALVVTTLASAGIALGAQKLSGSAFAMETVFAIGWASEIILLGNFFSSPRPPKKSLAILGVISALLILVGASGVIFYSSSLKAAAAKQIGVRGNYWQSALAMIRDRPLRGFGLDNFGAYYAHYLRPEGWETRRVHNVYLQLAVDGGVGLPLAFLAVWTVFFYRLPPIEKRSPYFPTGAHSPPFTRYALIAGGGAFVITYLLFITGAFGGLGIEFFTSALAVHDWTGIIVNGATNLLLLPLVWVLTARWFMSQESPHLALWLRIGMVAELLHFGFDFHFYEAANGSFLWLMAAMAMAANGQVEVKILSPRRQWGTDFVLALIIVGGTAMITLIHLPRCAAAIDRYVALKGAMVNSATPAQNNDLQRLIDSALNERPRDGELWLTRAAIKLRTGDLSAAIDSARAAVFANPQATGHKIYLAQLLERSPFLGNSEKNEIRNLYRAAIDFYPLKPRYRALYANFLWQTQMIDPDFSLRALAASALMLDENTSDLSQKLSPLEKEAARRISEIALN